QIPREIFSPLKAHAYRLDALPLANSQWISSPLTVAKMTMALDFKNADSILEIGCGSGYQAAILSKVIRRVFTMERIENLAKKAAQTFRELELFNINVKF
ncbi:rRNA adenine N-6-methyltransferase family protein, partial [Campylobacter coli]|uniref:rRNA adenine N-6-methyltransferase family protein n=2 Tax=Campylobacteraceae TaxID=72294 RepID=UPI003FA5C907